MADQIDGLRFLDCEIRMPLMSLHVRSAVVPVKNGNVLISPGSELTEADYASLKNITDIVAPNLLHCAGIPKAAKKFPRAKVWGVTGAKEARPEMPWTHELTEATWPYHEELAAVAIGGIPKVNETVFIHPHSSTVIVTDLCFNLTKASGIGAWIILNLFGTYRKFGVSKFYAKFIEDKAATRKSLAKLFQHDFKNIAMSHGDLVLGNGRAKMLAALAERDLSPE